MTKLLTCKYCSHIHAKSRMIRIYHKDSGSVDYVCKDIECFNVCTKVVHEQHIKDMGLL